jgi:hypothetical protein
LRQRHVVNCGLRLALCNANLLASVGSPVAATVSVATSLVNSMRCVCCNICDSVRDQ